jgi:hypothetical protein
MMSIKDSPLSSELSEPVWRAPDDRPLLGIATLVVALAVLPGMDAMIVASGVAASWSNGRLDGEGGG